MDKFFSLPVEKQNTILDAALLAFGTNGYKKTSVKDVASAAGISKAMVFHYFGTKKALYLYLIELCGRIFVKEVNEKFDSSVTDFFDRILLASEIELSVMKAHPAIPLFLNSIYFEKDAEVKDEIRAVFVNEEGKKFRNRIAFKGTDVSKFKKGVDPQLVMKMLLWIAYGYVSMSPGLSDKSLEDFDQDFKNLIRLLRNNLYQEEIP